MAEIVIKADIPIEFKEEFRAALAKVVEELIKRIRLLQFEQLKDKLDSKEEREIEEKAIKLGKEVNKSLHKKYKKLYSNLQYTKRLK